MILPSMAIERTSITPLSGRELLDPGQVFPREELLPRILSLFWRHCGGLSDPARPPAPVMRWSSAASEGGAGPAREQAWWIFNDAIVEAGDGLDAERLARSFGSAGESGQLWPRYEFQVWETPFAVDMSFHQDPGLRWSSRVRLKELPDGSVQVTGRGAHAS